VAENVCRPRDPSAAVENREAVVRSLFIRPADPTIPSGHLLKCPGPKLWRNSAFVKLISGTLRRSCSILTADLRSSDKR
jgi:hypothetical protein